MNNGVFSVGLILFVLGVLLAGYTLIINTSLGAQPDPYGQYAVPLVVLGLIVMIIGALVPSVTSTVTSTHRAHADSPHAAHTAQKKTRTTTVSEE
ncbi:MAG TPA: hypothetical protein VJK03_00400 [Candidatus Nanoarchaeia archaeon]|nr:hypothetical protein [Candidatus Nanoarchaeia archaeon]